MTKKLLEELKWCASTPYSSLVLETKDAQDIIEELECLQEVYECWLRTPCA